MTALASLEHDLVVAAAPSIIGAWATWWGARNHRSLRRLHRQIDPDPHDPNRTLSRDVSDIRADLMALGVLFGQHLVNDHDYEQDPWPARLRQRRPPPRRNPA